MQRYASPTVLSALTRARPPFFVAYPAARPRHDPSARLFGTIVQTARCGSSDSRSRSKHQYTHISPVRWGLSRQGSSAAQPELSSEPEKGDGQLEDAVPNFIRPDQRLPFQRLRPVIDTLPGPKDWAVAYGSGVQAQANAHPQANPPLTDFIFSTPSSVDFHTSNIRQNPTHYPLSARLLGGAAVAWLQDRWGAGVWYVTMVKVKGMDVKYGVISTERLKRDLTEWETLYVAGRLHKPVLPLIQPSSMNEPLERNASAALRLSLLILPERFTELQLYEQIAGISYSGDPRMAVPGAENPEKVRNIVRGPAALEGFRQMYRPEMERLGVVSDASSADTKDTLFTQPSSVEHRIELLEGLPLTLRNRLATHLNPKSTDSTQTHGAENALGALTNEPKLRAALLQEVKKIIGRPALTQSVKGLFTAGFRKSVLYSLEKIKKWWRARSSSKA